MRPGKKRDGPKAFMDLHQIKEDERITLIGQTAMNGQTVAFVVEDDGDKGDRYLGKLKKKFPAIRLIDRFKGPVKDCETLKVGPPDPERN